MRPGRSGGIRFAIGILFLFLGISFTVQSLGYRNLNARFDGPVVRVQGVVDDVVQLQGASSSKGSSSGTHRINYHFDAADGRHQNGCVAAIATCNSLHHGDPVPVKYLPGDPATSRLDLPLEDSIRRQEVWIDFAVGFFSILFGLFFLWKWRRS